MLTPEQIEGLREAASRLTDPINEYIIRDVSRRVAKAGKMTSTAAYQLWRAREVGMAMEELEAYLQEYLGMTGRDVQRLYRQAAQYGYDLDVKRLGATAAPAFADNLALQQIVAASLELAGPELRNIINTKALGFITPDGQVMMLENAYYRTLDVAYSLTASGACDYSTAVRRACNMLCDGGVKVVTYQSGQTASLEAAVRRCVIGGLGLMQEQINQRTHDDLGCDGWEITAHANSAPDHEPIQGKQYSDKEYQELNDSLRRRIGTLNCGHAAFGIILGVSSPQYTPQELARFRTQNEEGITYEGRHYTGYEATQMQRKLERAIRKQKNQVIAARETDDPVWQRQSRSKLAILRQRYREFSKEAGLRQQNERTFVSGFSGK